MSSGRQSSRSGGSKLSYSKMVRKNPAGSGSSDKTSGGTASYSGTGVAMTQVSDSRNNNNNNNHNHRSRRGRRDRGGSQYKDDRDGRDSRSGGGRSGGGSGGGGGGGGSRHRRRQKQDGRDRHRDDRGGRIAGGSHTGNRGRPRISGDSSDGSSGQGRSGSRGSSGGRASGGSRRTRSGRRRHGGDRDRDPRDRDGGTAGGGGSRRGGGRSDSMSRRNHHWTEKYKRTQLECEIQWKSCVSVDSQSLTDLNLVLTAYEWKLFSTDSHPRSPMNATKAVISQCLFCSARCKVGLLAVVRYMFTPKKRAGGGSAGGSGSSMRRGRGGSSSGADSEASDGPTKRFRCNLPRLVCVECAEDQAKHKKLSPIDTGVGLLNKYMILQRRSDISGSGGETSDASEKLIVKAMIRDNSGEAGSSKKDSTMTDADASPASAASSSSSTTGSEKGSGKSAESAKQQLGMIQSIAVAWQKHLDAVHLKTGGGEDVSLTPGFEDMSVAMRGLNLENNHHHHAHHHGAMGAGATGMAGSVDSHVTPVSGSVSYASRAGASARGTAGAMGRFERRTPAGAMPHHPVRAEGHTLAAHSTGMSGAPSTTTTAGLPAMMADPSKGEVLEVRDVRTIEQGKMMDPFINGFLICTQLVKTGGGDKAGLHVGDVFVRFGAYSKERFPGLKAIATLVRRNASKVIFAEVWRKVEREDGGFEYHHIRLSLIPLKSLDADGGGVLGAVINTYPLPQPIC